MNRQLTANRTGIFLVIILLFIMPASKAQSIISVSPQSGPVGSSITISGTGFSTVAAQNIVYVGGIRASVIAASANSLTVTAPAGEAPVKISVTVGGLTAYSRNPFVVTFEGDTTGFKQRHFESSQEIYMNHVGTADINNDGKSDLILLTNSHGVSIAVNTSSPGQVSFGNEQNFESAKIFSLSATGDLDGDGKIDLVLMDSLANSFNILRNTTNGGTVSFAPLISYVVSSNGPGNFIVISDLDSDGRPDIVTNNASTFQLSIYKNQSSPGNISFDPALNLDVPGFADALRIADMDGDGKPDLVPHTRTYFYQFPVFINSSTPGAFSFAISGYPIYADLATLSNILGDLNQDQLPDAVVTNTNRSYTYCFQNTSTAGNFTKADAISLFSENGSVCSSIGDLDGDGKPDVVVANYMRGLFLFKNRSAAGGELSFADSMLIPVFGFADTTILCDVDADGVLDIILHNSDRVNILRNTMGICVPTAARVDLQVSADTVCAGSTVTLTAIAQNGGASPTYQWKVNGNNVPNNSSNQLTTGALTVDTEITVIMTSNSTCVSSVVDSAIRLIEVNPALTTFITVTPSSNKVCTGTNVTFTATAVNGGTAPAYRWKKNGVNVGSNNPVYNDNALVAGDSVTVTLTSNAICASPVQVTSAAVRVAIDPGLDPVITISGDTEVEPGDVTLLTSAVTNPGTGSTYQWQDSTAAHGWQNIIGATSTTLSYEPLFSGDRVRCKLSCTVCSVLRTVTSNALSFQVLTGGRLLRNPVDVMLNIVDLKPSDNWLQLDIVNLSTGATVKSENIQNKTIVSIFVMDLSPGIYAAVLKRSSGPWNYLRFVKL